MTTMASHSSATAREHTPHVNQTTRTAPVINALKRGAQAVLNDDEPQLSTESSAVGPTAEPEERDESREKVEALAEIICGAGEESAGALLVLMGQMENSEYPQAIVNTVKHLAFTRCGELNVHGMVDTQIALLEGELLRSDVRPDQPLQTK
jgi:hypothetical protein